MLRLLLVGFGAVGRQLARVLGSQKERFSWAGNVPLAVVGILTRHHGSLANPKGLRLEEVLARSEEEGGFFPSHPDFLGMSTAEAAAQLDYDVLLELTPLDLQSRAAASIERIRIALQRGKHVVSANKGPVVFAYRELARLAERRGVLFRFESTVLDGAPVFNLFRNCLPGCRIRELEGILNSTTNFVLTRLEEGCSFEQSLREAQEMGITESDPSYDLEGWDAAVKTSLLAQVLMEEDLSPFQVSRQGLAPRTAQQVQEEIRKGRRLKVVCRVWREGEKVRGEVALRSLPPQHPFFRVEGTGCILRLSTDCMSPLLIQQERPTLQDTVYGLVADLLEIHRRGKNPSVQD